MKKNQILIAILLVVTLPLVIVFGLGIFAFKTASVILDFTIGE